MTIFNPDGSEVAEIILPDGTQASQVVGPDGTVLWSAGSDIPDSVVSRPQDNTSFETSGKRGIVVNVASDAWSDIGGSISDDVSGATRAQIFRQSDATLVGETDISGLSAGDSFVVEGVNLDPDTDYNFVLDADGSEWSPGSLGGANYPYISDDDEIEMVDGATGEDGTASAAYSLVSIGVGFD